MAVLDFPQNKKFSSEKSSSFSSPAKSVVTSPDFPSSPGDHFHSTQHSRSSPNIAHSPKVQSPGSDFPFTDFESQNGSTRTTNNEHSPMSKDETAAKSGKSICLKFNFEVTIVQGSDNCAFILSQMRLHILCLGRFRFSLQGVRISAGKYGKIGLQSKN